VGGIPQFTGLFSKDEFGKIPSLRHYQSQYIQVSLQYYPRTKPDHIGCAGVSEKPTSNIEKGIMPEKSF
jgi:hypothetical protein